jgi:hypothetical protein
LALCRRYLGVTALLLLGGALPATAVSEDGSPRPDPNAVNVLLIYTTPRLAPSIVAIDEAFRATLESRLARPVFFYTEYLDLEAADSAEPSLREFLLRKYSGRRLDLILTVSSPALRFALQYRPRLFVGVPIVFAAVDPTAVAGDTLDADVTGTWLKQAWAPTLDAALRLHPGTRRVVVITGSGAPDKVWLAEARTQLAPYQSRRLSDRRLVRRDRGGGRRSSSRDHPPAGAVHEGRRASRVRHRASAEDARRGGERAGVLVQRGGAGHRHRGG